MSSFDSMAFYKALDSVREHLDFTWKKVSEKTSVSASTLTRMAQGRRPDADSLAKLSAWANINPADYVSNIEQASNTVALNKAIALFRADKNLSKEAVIAMEEMIRAAYNSLSKVGEDATGIQKRG